MMAIRGRIRETVREIDPDLKSGRLSRSKGKGYRLTLARLPGR
jgi:hypothetical protein